MWGQRTLEILSLLAYGASRLLSYLCPGFGMAGLPGVWTILFTHCLMGMARSDNVVDLPVVIHVDDVAIVAAYQDIVDAQSQALADFLIFLGVL